MQYAERDEGDYRIHAQATGGELGDGYVAAVVISRVRGATVPREAFRNEALAGGYHWPSPEAALCYAMGKGRELVASEPSRLAC
jgi:hypothetical protein